ncbi:MAG: nucleotide exchange factor GrpE [Candidatus Makana argininalis]
MLNNNKNNIINDKCFKKKSEEKNINLENKKNEIKSFDIKDKYIKKLKKTLKKEKEITNNNFLRYRAEIENLIKRNEKDIKKINKFAIEQFTIELLPVIDSLEKTIDIFDKKNLKLKSIYEGLNLTFKFLLGTFNKFGLSVINDVNVIFDPNIHQAMNVIQSDQFKSNCIINIMQKGYILNGRLIRPALVSVAK